MPDQNTPQFENWNGPHGEKWVANRDVFDRQLASHGGPAMEAAGIAPGIHAIDIGCGFGTTSLEIANHVGANGSVLGVDFSKPMINEAKFRATEAGIENLRFDQADVQSYDFKPGSADALFSRYGVMFYDDPVMAFSNMREGLRQGGRIGFICWRRGDENVWMSGPTKIAARHLELPPPPAGSPGMFAFAQKDRIDKILSQSGFKDISITELDLTVNVGPNVDTAVQNAMTLAPWAQALSSATPGTGEKISAEIRRAMSEHETADGVTIPSASWLVSAQG